MAQSAKPNPVYDDESSSEPVTRPDLRAIQGGGKGDGVPRGNLRAAEEGGLYRPDSPADSGGGQANPDELRSSEEESDGGFANGFDQPKRTTQRGFLQRHKSKIILGGVLTGGIAGGFGALLLLLIPLKIEHIVNNLEGHFFSSSQSAVSDMTQNLLKDYVINWLIPDYSATHCTTTVDIHCKVTIYSTKNDPVTNLYRTWAHARIENTLATKYKIELQYKPTSRTWYIKAPGTSAGGDNIGSHGQGLDREFTRVDRGGVRASINDAVAQETLWKRMLIRYKVGRLLSVKFGNKRYIFFNGTRNAFHGQIADIKKAAKLELTQRVITPRNESLGIALECLLTDCDATNTQQTDPAEAPEQNGFPENPETDTKIRQSLGDIASKYGVTDLADVQNTYEDIARDGYQKYLVTKALTPIIGEANATSAADKIPIIGWVNLAAQLVNGASNAGPNIKKLSYAVNIGAAVNLWVMYRTMADEVHTGHDNAGEVGAMVSSLNGGNTGGPNDPELGGTASAEQAPLYNSLVNNSGQSATVGSMLASVLPANAYADSVSSNNSSFGPYLCNNGKPVPSGQLVCPEEVMGGGNAVANSVHSFLNDTPVLSQITGMAKAWEYVFGPISKFIGGIFGDAMNLAAKPINGTCDLADSVGIPAPAPINLFCIARDSIKEASPAIIKGVTSALIPDPFGTNMSGGRTLEMMGAGADGSGQTYAQEGLGAKKVKPTVSAAIYQKQQDEARLAFEQQPLFARMFDTNSQFSLMSSLAMTVPLNWQHSAAPNFASVLGNPLGTLTSSFGSIFSGKTAAAAPSDTDPYGIPQYAYPDGSIPSNPGAYWDQHCSDNAAQAYQSDADFAAHSWNKANSEHTDPANGMPESTTTNPCLLIKAAVGSAGGKYDTSLLTPDDTADIAGGSSSPPSGDTTSGGCGGSGKYSALVGPGSSFAGVDQGIDFVPSGSGGFDICAPAPGTITLADQTGHHFGRTTGQAEIIEKLDQPPNAPSSSQYIYYAEIIKINSNIHVGVQVSKGDLIGHSDQSPGIEVGWGLNPTKGFMCPIGYPTPCGTSFDNWVQGQ